MKKEQRERQKKMKKQRSLRSQFLVEIKLKDKNVILTR